MLTVTVPKQPFHTYCGILPRKFKLIMDHINLKDGIDLLLIAAQFLEAIDKLKQQDNQFNKDRVVGMKREPEVPTGKIQTKRREICMVCGDEATGYHYKAITCEGCKV